MVINILKSLGMLLTAFSASMLPPIMVAWWYDESTSFVFILSALAIFLLGIFCWLPFRKQKNNPHPKEGFLIVFLFWLVLSVVGSFPFILSENPHLSIVDAIFESTSGLTATGSTVITGLANLPRSIVYYRQQLQFLGGMGIILLAIAVLPTLGFGSMELFKAEISGPIKDNQMTPRIAQTAKSIWTIYIGLTLFCIISYWAAGMSLFDAIGYSFGTVSTGGYTTHDQSMGYFQSEIMQLIAIFFMFASSVSFALHYVVLKTGKIKYYWENFEFKFFLKNLIVCTVFVFILLHFNQTFDNPLKALIEATFQIVSLATTTGMSSSNYNSWPQMAPLLLLLLGMIGGCAGSTSGGIKVIRFLLLNLQSIREVKRLIHPHATFVIKLGNSIPLDRILNTTFGFLAIYSALFFIFLLLLTATDVDFLTAFSATAAALSNIGPGLGGVCENFAQLHDFAKLLLSLAMLIGRLEIFTVIILLSPLYWRA